MGGTDNWVEWYKSPENVAGRTKTDINAIQEYYKDNPEFLSRIRSGISRISV